MGGVSPSLVLASQAFKCTNQTIESFHNLPAVAISIKDELRALELVIDLASSAPQDSGAIRRLGLLLKHCVKESDRFSALIAKCKAHSSNPGTSLRDWGQLNLPQKEVSDFRNLLSRAKLTISLELGGLNLQGDTATIGLIHELKGLVKKNSVDISKHMDEIIARLRELNERGTSISDDDRIRWDELQIEKVKCEKEISALAEVDKQLDKVELDHLESFLSDEKVHQNVHKALKRTTPHSVTVSDVRYFITKLPHLIYELTTRLSFIEREQEVIAAVNKKMRERLLAEKKVDESCMQSLEEVTKKIKKSALVMRNVRGAQDADQVFISTFDQLLHCENVSTGRGGRLWFGSMSDSSIQALCRTRGTPASSPALQFSATPSRREILLLSCFIGMLVIIGLNVMGV